MQKSIIIALSLIACLFLLVSCTESDCVEGSSNLVYKPYNNLDNYDKIVLNVPGAIVFEKNISDTNLLLTVDDNIENFINIYVSGGTLFIESDDKVQICPSRLRINIFRTNFISSLEINGSGSFAFGDSISHNEFSGIINGSGLIAIDSIFAEIININVNGSGEVNIEGKCNNLNAAIHGSGEFNFFDLESIIADVEILGDGDIDVYAVERLIANIEGSGVIRYKGDPELQTNIVGSGSISKYD